MIVLDASVVVELLINGSRAAQIRAALAARSDALAVPHLLDIEVTSALRALTAGQRIDSHQCGRFLEELIRLPAQRVAHTPFLKRIWELRHNFTAYDGAYIALAEAIGADLFTCDEKLRRGHRAAVTVFSR